MVRVMTMEDYDQVKELWNSIQGFGIRSMDDSREGVARFLKRNPTTSVVAEEDGKVVGAILCGHDGRRGCLYHVCVHKDYRMRGIGKSMVAFAMEALKKEEINKVLHSESGRYDFRSRDRSGHGTHVASICAGINGVAPEAELIVVKLGDTREKGFPRTTQLMTALQYVINEASQAGRTVAVNISYGHNYGDHRGNSLLERFISQIAQQWKCTICIGTGNEGNSGKHKQGKLIKEEQKILLDIAPFEQNLNLQIWKDFVDELRIQLESPSGISYEITDKQGKSQYAYGNTIVFVYNGYPTPYNVRQEIFLSFIVQEGNHIESGQWNLTLIPRNIRNGEYQMWLPVSLGSNQETRFLEPDKEFTLTIPSTAEKVISAGAYDVRYQSYADFSGRGDQRYGVKKPDLVAPGVGTVSYTHLTLPTT